MDTSGLAQLTQHYKSRDDGFRILINRFNCKVGVELGVRFGYFSSFLLNETGLQVLHGIDIDKNSNISSVEATFGPRYKFILSDGIKAAEQFADDSLDFIYHDSCHKENYVYDELNAWWPKAKSGAIIAGDDYMQFYVGDEGHFGVIQAVDRFTKEKNIGFSIIGTNATNPNELTQYGINMGNELTKKLNGHHNTFTQVPNWYLIKP